MNLFDNSLLDQAVMRLREGGVVAFPTDTVYGVGVHPFQPAAVRKLYRIKGRPIDKPIPILVGSIGDVECVAQNLPRIFFELAERFWPGGLTLIIEAKALPPEVTAGGKTVGVRMPNHSLALDLIRRFGLPVATTSANRSDELPATSAEEVRPQLGGLVDLILDGGQTFTKIASTVLDLSVSPPLIRRYGDISADELAPYLTDRPKAQS
ncbi:MAG: L-threonylcarbamoyladenylate synthase [Candidatus Poribacteria bacterium]|nr:L-threonylcarbamoyladenylate synthase [Candidatus Poribacteria bacterium]